jgi:bidirectional [NiFe] hydrogenase diaphorase subunit
MVKLFVDDREIQAEEGANLLHVSLQNGIYIPNLCYLEGMESPPASCRLCLIEIDGENRPTTACTEKVRDGLIVRTDTPVVRRLQRSALSLLLSVHDVDCARCPANKKCELQRMARFLKTGLKPKRLEKLLKDTQVEEDHPFLRYYPNRCVLCGRCTYVCRREHGQPFLTFARRGFNTVITFYGEKELSSPPCQESIACAEICPVAAIIPRESQNPHPESVSGHIKPDTINQ